MMYTWNVDIDVLFHRPFSDLRSDEYSLSHCEIKSKITPEWPRSHRDSMAIDLIANRRMGDETSHQTAYFRYTLCDYTMRTPILNWSQKSWRLRSGFSVETRCNGLVPDRNRTLNWTGNFDPLLTLVQGRMNLDILCISYMQPPRRSAKTAWDDVNVVAKRWL